MATLTKTNKNGHVSFMIQYFATDGIRKTIRISSKFTENVVRDTKETIERLLYCHVNELIVDAKTTSTFNMLPEKIRQKISEQGLFGNPSETLALRWDDIDWAHNRFTVRSSKTARYQGKSSRIVPLFRELRQELERLWAMKDVAQSSCPFVIRRYRDTATNMRTAFAKIVYRAGLEQWERLFHNLRGSRSNELFSEYPTHVAAEWMGQSNRIAEEHYLHTTQADFDHAVACEDVVLSSRSPLDQ